MSESQDDHKEPGQSPAFTMKSGLVNSVEKILRRQLTGAEVQHWNSIQDQYGIADDDPIVIVLTLLAVHQHLFNDLPKQIEEATQKAITVHRTTLEDQATIVSKALLAKLAPMFIQASSDANRQAGIRGLGFQIQPWMVTVFGLMCGGFGAWLWHLISR